MYRVKIILDSINKAGNRFTTAEAEYARNFHSEVLTHRKLSRNSASSRAIPASKLRERVINDPVVPLHFGKNQKGMQAREEIEDIEAAKAWWAKCIKSAVDLHEEGERLGLHKQVVNRIIEPFMFNTVIISATNYDNLFFLRYHKDALPEFEWLARNLYEAIEASTPTLLQPGEWHMPFIRPEDWEHTNGDIAMLKKISVARCARVSYLTHDGRRDYKEDIRLHDDLCKPEDPNEPLHLSPFEHVAVALEDSASWGNLEGWKQYRKEFEREAGPVKFVPRSN